MEYFCKNGDRVTAAKDGKLESVWCLCSDGVRRHIRRTGTGQTEIMFGRVTIQGYTVSGHIVQTQGGYEFRKNPKGKNANLLP